MQVYFLIHSMRDIINNKEDYSFLPFFSKEAACGVLEEQDFNEESFRKNHEIYVGERVDCYSSPLRKMICSEMSSVQEIWEISEHEVRAKPGERFYALLHYDTGNVGSAHVEVYKAKNTARNHMKENAYWAEENLMRRLGDRYEYAEWHIDKDWREVDYCGGVEKWRIQMYKIPPQPIPAQSSPIGA